MAALDVLQLATAAVSAATNTLNFSAVAAGDLILFFVSHTNGGVTITPPAGVTPFTQRGTQWPKLATYARVVQSGDATGWAFGFDNSDPSYIHGYRIEGPFTDLSGITITDDDSFGAVASRRILLSDVTVAANTLAIAGVAKYNTATASFDNSFGNVQNSASEGITSLASARRLYTGAATDVHSTASWTGSNTGNAALARIAAPSTPPAASSVGGINFGLIS